MKLKTFVLQGISVVVTTAGLVSATGCSAEEPSREFSVPKALCGVSVPVDALSRLLPASGKKLTAEADGSTDDALLCTVSVDGVRVLDLSRERIVAGDSARHILLTQLRVARPKLAEGNTIAYAGHAAVSLLKCRGAAVEEEDISILINVLKPGRSDEPAMKSLISDYTARVKKRRPASRRPPERVSRLPTGTTLPRAGPSAARRTPNPPPPRIPYRHRRTPQPDHRDQPADNHVRAEADVAFVGCFTEVEGATDGASPWRRRPRVWRFPQGVRGPRP